jgi:hypothetical protein
MTEDYAPFPEAELRDMVLYALPANRAILKSALLSFAALRERCLIAETENAQLHRRREDLIRHISGSDLEVLRQLPSAIPDGVGLGDDVHGGRAWMYDFVERFAAAFSCMPPYPLRCASLPVGAPVIASPLHPDTKC